jgi:argininosuccinate lyase
MIEMPEEFVATSSIMPQKKNPVIAELVRAKAGRVSGNLLGALAVTKALPQAYNLDLQELTPLLWSSVDETRDSAAIIAKIIDGIEPKREVMRKRAEQGFTTATELADLLVREAGLAFRDAHAVVGRMVTRAVDAGKGLRELELEDLRAASREVVGKEVEIASAEFRRALDVEECVRARVLPGGPAPKAIKEQLKSLKRETRNFGKLMRARRRAIAKSEAKLIKEAKRRLR